MPEEVAAEEEQQEQITEESNVLGMSDEELLDMPAPDTIEPESETEEVDEEEEVKEDEDSAQKTEGTDAEDDNSTEVEEDTTAVKDDKEAISTDKEDTEETSKLDYKAEYDKLLAPFRANGKDIQINNVADAITLMQQGANYNKKMAGLKPNLKLMKMLENNELLDEAKLSFLIDLNKKNPEAVQKFIKESGLDPLDIDTEKDTEYSPNSYTVDDTEVELDAVLDDIRDTQSFNETIDIISNKLDASSKKILLEQPDTIRVLNEHVANGVYGQITQVVENERMLGRLKGFSDLEAYKQVGDIIQANGGFNVNKQKPNQIANEEVKPNTVDKSKDDPKLKNRKRAASSTKSMPAKKVSKDFNPLSLSDEEFEKLAGSQYL